MPRHPAEFTDTDPRVMEVWLGVLREKTPDERLASRSISPILRCEWRNPAFAHGIPRHLSARFFCAAPRFAYLAT
jgi:hypothetical protein